MFKVVEEFIDAARGAADEQALCNAFETAIGEVGYDHFAAGSSAGFESPRPGTVWLRRYPEDWARHYMEREFWKVDPTLRLASVMTRPFRWNDPAVCARYTERERFQMAIAAGAGAHAGVTIPIRGAFMFPGQVNIYSVEREVDARSVANLYNLSVCFYDMARRLAAASASRPATDTAELSPVECECLLWASVGKMDWEIAELAGMTELNARIAIERAKRKLGVPTRIQAVVRAVLSGKINP